MYFCRTNKAEQYFDIAMDLYFHKGVGATQIIRLPPQKTASEYVQRRFSYFISQIVSQKVDVIPQKNHLESNECSLISCSLNLTFAFRSFFCLLQFSWIWA